jgi:hypothetical protein
MSIQRIVPPSSSFHGEEDERHDTAPATIANISDAVARTAWALGLTAVLRRPRAEHVDNVN